MNQIPRYVYFVRPTGLPGPIKIGCSTKPARRLTELGVWSPWPLEVIAVAPGDLSTEKALHELFADDRWHHEWFHASPRLAAFVNDLKRNVPLADALARDAVRVEPMQAAA